MPSLAQNLVSPYMKAAPVASANDTRLTKTTTSIQTPPPYADQGDSRAATHPLHLLVLLSPPVVDRSDLGQPVYMAKHCSVDKLQTMHRLRLATMSDLMCRKNHIQAMADRLAPPTGVPQTVVHSTEQ